tara:strand:+ start:1358 stop:1465 length:108 start_codon:yes stop_codon:yes gene_type:complete
MNRAVMCYWRKGAAIIRNGVDIHYASPIVQLAIYR